MSRNIQSRQIINSTQDCVEIIQKETNGINNSSKHEIENNNQQRSDKYNNSVEIVNGKKIEQNNTQQQIKNNNFQSNGEMSLTKNMNELTDSGENSSPSKVVTFQPQKRNFEYLHNSTTLSYNRSKSNEFNLNLNEINSSQLIKHLILIKYIINLIIFN